VFGSVELMVMVVLLSLGAWLGCWEVVVVVFLFWVWWMGEWFFSDDTRVLVCLG